MRGFRKLVFERFDQRMAARFPDFTYRHYPEVPATDSWVRTAASGTHWHLVPRVGGYLTIHLEVCRMMNDRSPVWGRVGTPEDSPNENGLRFGISHLWSPDDSGWAVLLDPEDLGIDDGRIRLSQQEIVRRSTLEPDTYRGANDKLEAFVLIEDMMDKIQSFALPYMEASETKETSGG